MSDHLNSDLAHHLAKLMRRAAISEGAQRAFLSLVARKEAFPAHRDIVREGEAIELTSLG